jgi:hypothetical protein
LIPGGVRRQLLTVTAAACVRDGTGVVGGVCRAVDVCTEQAVAIDASTASRLGCPWERGTSRTYLVIVNGRSAMSVAH